MNIVDKLNYLKAKLNITTEELANQSGVPVGTINKILSGETRNPTGKTATKLAKVLGVTAEFLINDDLEGQNKAPDTLLISSEARVKKVYDILHQALLDAGWLTPGEHLTEQQAKILSAMIDILDATFTRNT